MASACAATSAGGQIDDVGDADRQNDAVDRLARPVLPQHFEEGEPAPPVDLGVRILRGVAPGRVDQHRLVGEPPVAVSRSADALNGFGRGVAGQRKLQAGIDERRRLARAGRPDDEIPGQVVESACARLAGALEGCERILHLFLQDRRVALLLGRLGHRLRDGGGGAAPGDDAPDDRTADDQQNDEDDDEARDDALERLRVADGDERPGEPDERRKNQRADNAERDQEPADPCHR